MSGGKACGKQAAQHPGKQPDEGSVAASRDTAVPENEVHSSGDTHRKSMRLKEMSAAKQAGGKGEPENGKQPAAQKKRTRTTRQATQMQPALLAADAPFAGALQAVPSEDWCRTWVAGRTIMLRRTSKRVKEIVDKMRLPAVIRLSRSFWGDARNGTAAEKLQFVIRQLAFMTGWCRIITFELPRCDMKGQDADNLAGVLAQCPALAHLDLSRNGNFGAAGVERLAGVLGQCRELVHLNLSNNTIGPVGAERLAGVLGLCRELSHLDLSYNYIRAGGAERLAGVLAHCTALAHLDLSFNRINADGAESLAGVLAQCTALAHLDLGANYFRAAGAESLARVLGQCPTLAHLNLGGNQIGPAGAESLARVLVRCTALAHLNLRYNDISAAGRGRLRASWRGQTSGLLLEEVYEDEDEAY
jgi:hypothetical protein